jgi:hypothetical protein
MVVPQNASLFVAFTTWLYATVIRNESSYPEVTVIWDGVGVTCEGIGLHDDIVSLTDAYQDRRVEIRLNRHKICCHNLKPMTIDREDECRVE